MGTNLGKVRRVYGMTNKLATFLIWSNHVPILRFDLLVQSLTFQSDATFEMTLRETFGFSFHARKIHYISCFFRFCVRF